MVQSHQTRKGNYKSSKNLPSIRKKSRTKTANQVPTVKSVTNAVISYLHYKGAANGIENPKGRDIRSINNTQREKSIFNHA